MRMLDRWHLVIVGMILSPYESQRWIVFSLSLRNDLRMRFGKRISVAFWRVEHVLKVLSLLTILLDWIEILSLMWICWRSFLLLRELRWMTWSSGLSWDNEHILLFVVDISDHVKSLSLFSLIHQLTSRDENIITISSWCRFWFSRMLIIFITSLHQHQWSFWWCWFCLRLSNVQLVLGSWCRYCIVNRWVFLGCSIWFCFGPVVRWEI